MFSVGQKGSLTLDARNESAAMWVFQTRGNFSAESYSTMILTNGALASNVYWIVGGSANLEYASYVAGNILAQSSIMIGPYTILDGRCLSLSAVTVAGPSSLKVPFGPTPVVRPVVKLYLGDSADFAILAGTTVTFGPSLTVIASGSVGSLLKDGVTGNYMLEAGETESGSKEAIRGMAAFDTVDRVAASSVCTTNLEKGCLSGLTLSPGVYCTNPETLSLTTWTSMTLDAQGVSTSLWVFQSNSTLVTGDYSSVQLTNGALASNVFWSIGSTATLGASSYFVGQILATTDILLGSRCVLNGRGFSKKSVTFLGNSQISTNFTRRPAKQPSDPMFRKGSVCVISSINSRFNQGLWSGTDAPEAMMQAISISMGVNIGAVQFGLARQLCLNSPTGAPSARPSPRHVKISKPSSGELVLTDYSRLLTAAVTKPLSFSIYRDVPGKKNASKAY